MADGRMRMNKEAGNMKCVGNGRSCSGRRDIVAGW